MNLFPFDAHLIGICCGIYAGIATLIKEYRKNIMDDNKKCFPLFALAVFFWELVMAWGVITICSDFLDNVKNIGSYAIFCWAVSCFCYSGYMFSGIVTNDDEAKKEKFRGKVAIFCGLYFLLITVISYEM